MTTRREFITGVTIGASAVIAGHASASGKEEAFDSPLGAVRGETITLGRTGLRVSRIGLGAAHFTRNKTKVLVINSGVIIQKKPTTRRSPIGNAIINLGKEV